MPGGAGPAGEELAGLLLDPDRDALIVVGPGGAIRQWDGAAAALYGIPPGEALGRRWSELFTSPLPEPDPDLPWRGRLRQTSAAGRVVEVEAALARRPADAGLLAVFRLAAAAAPVAGERQQRFAAQLLDALEHRAAMLDSGGRVAAANARWRAGAAERERCSCGPVAEGADWLAALREAGEPETARFGDDVAAVLGGRRPAARWECRCSAGGADRVTATEVVPLRGGVSGAVVVQSDASWRRRLEDELTHRATHDDLTGLPNRAALVERLAASLRRLEGRRSLAVLFCDLDGFKEINDGLGHGVGDQVLVAVARRLRQRCRSADVVARFGGDEFVVVLPVGDVRGAVAMADRLIEVLSEPIAVGDAEVAPGASIGITVVDQPPRGEDPVAAVLRDADTAMYHAKERGRGRYEVFDQGLRADAAGRLELAAALRRAEVDREFHLEYQGRRDCRTRELVAAEALLRWEHPLLGPVQPAEFVPVAERSGRMPEIGAWALRRVLADVAATAADPASTGVGLPPTAAVAVNISPRQLAASGFIASVEQALIDFAVPAERLMLEVAEASLIDDPAAARTVLTGLRRLGVRISLDDFGAGMSSLSQLRRLPLTALSIDRSFISDLVSDESAKAVVAAIISLGHGMGLTVVAEGVESVDQLELLRDLGCDQYQGYLDGAPAPRL